MTDKIKAFMEADALQRANDHLKWLKDTAVDKQDLARVVGYEDCLREWREASRIAPDLAKMVDDLRAAKEALETVQWNPTQSCLGEVNEEAV